MKGWLDNFGKADNANDSNVSLPEGFVGLGYNTKGRNYSPAWGGQFQDGGEIAQRGKQIDKILNANKNLDWVQGLYDPNYGSVQIPGQEGRSTHFMESADRRVYPTVRNIDGQLKYLGDDAYNYADSTNSYIEFPTDRKAQKFAKNYKRGTGVLDFQKGGKLIPVSPMQQITGETPTISPTVPYLQTKDPAEFYKSWIQSPEYERRLKSTGYSDVPNKQRVDELSQIEQVKKERLGLLENIQPLEYDPSKRSEAIIDYYDGSTINVNPSDYKTFSKQSVEAHEIAHVATPTSTMSNDEFGIFMGSKLPLKKPIVSGVQGSKEREASIEAAGDFEHLGKPWEAKADLDALRFMMYDKGIYDITKGKKFTESDFEKVKQSFGKERVFKRFTDRMGKENFVKLMNTIAKADGDEELPMAMGGMSIPGSVGFTYARTGSTPSNGKYAKKTMASAQNGQEMKFYQNGLDWKSKSMQNGGEEMYEGQQLPEITITPYDEQYPFYQTLSPEQKKYINDEGPIGRGVRAIATTGKVGQTAKDISTPYRTVQEVASEVTGIPGTIRFAKDPVENLLGLERTLFNTAVSSSPFLPTTPYNQEDLQSTFNTIDALGLGSMMAAPLVKPTSAAARAAGKAVVPHLTSISNVANETLDAVQAINNAKKFEKLSMVDVPALPGIDKLKDVRNFGKELAELESKSKNASLSDLKSLREKYTKLSEQAKEFKSSGIFKVDDANKQSSFQTDSDINLHLINNKLNKLSNFKLDDFINNLKKQGANKVALETLRNNPDLALRYSDTVSSFSDSRMAEELITGDTLSALENFRTYPNSGKTTNFSPNRRGIFSDTIDATTGGIKWLNSNKLTKIDNKIYEDDWGIDKFYSYPFYKNVGDKIVDAYSNLRLSGSPIVSPLQQSSEAIELMPSLFADRYNVGSMLRQASRYIDETPDGLMFPAGSLSGDSYPLALNMMARELKNNPDSKLRLMGFGRSNELGFADKIKNPKLLQSELSQIIKGIEDISGQRLPKPYVFGDNTDQVMLPKFAISKGSTNKAIQDYLNNSSIADRLGVKRPVREVSSNPATPLSDPQQTIDFDFSDYDFDTNFKNGGVTKDNRGYWNPDNWGKPVEIDSNDITMQGVYEPLLGVSDTGDTKLMKPGKNYKFKGKKVTEFPVAQYGKGIPFKDAANNPKDAADPIRKDLAPPIRPKASFEEQKRIAKLEMDKYGYTSDQRKGYVKGKSEKAFKNIVPQGYGDLTKTLDRIERYEKNLGRNPEETIWYGAEDSSTGKPIYYDLPKRDDAFALYLGLPQKNKSFGISEYQPGDSKENKYYFKPNYLDENLKNRLVKSYLDNVDDDTNVYIANERTDAFGQKTDSLRRAGVPNENPIYAKWMVDNPLGDFKMSKGKDEKGHYISIYDNWDLNPFKEGEGASSNAAAATLKAFAKMKGVDVSDDTEISTLFGAGKPFEIYDRIYYDPKTKKVIPQKRNGGGVGINQLDAQPMKKLNQLLNFTNNPDKDNWLDKYN